MITDIEGSELEVGDMVVVTKKVKRIVDVGDKREVYLEDGTEFTVMDEQTLTISTNEIRLR